MALSSAVVEEQGRVPYSGVSRDRRSLPTYRMHDSVKGPPGALQGPYIELGEKAQSHYRHLRKLLDVSGRCTHRLLNQWAFVTIYIHLSASPVMIVRLAILDAFEAALLTYGDLSTPRLIVAWRVHNTCSLCSRSILCVARGAARQLDLYRWMVGTGVIVCLASVTREARVKKTTSCKCCGCAVFCGFSLSCDS
jgi:hypothetical protein